MQRKVEKHVEAGTGELTILSWFQKLQFPGIWARSDNITKKKKQPKNQHQGISLSLTAWLVLSSCAAGSWWPLLSLLPESPRVCQQTTKPDKCSTWKTVQSLGMSTSQTWRWTETCQKTLQSPSSLVQAGEEGGRGDVLCMVTCFVQIPGYESKATFYTSKSPTCKCNWNEWMKKQISYEVHKSLFFLS